MSGAPQEPTIERADVEGTAIPVLPARDLPETLQLFERLGFEARSDEVNGYAVVRRGGIELHFTLTPDHDPWTSAGMAFIRLAEVESLYHELKATGALPIVPASPSQLLRSERRQVELHEGWERGESIARMGELVDQPWGIREFALLDPSNNLLRFGQILR